MKFIVPLLLGTTIIFSFTVFSAYPTFAQSVENEQFSGEREDLNARNQYEWMRQHDPTTGLIPPNIHVLEMQFAKQLPTRENFSSQERLKSGGAQTLAENWALRGPFNIGGRTRALAVDVSDTNNILAGGTSGGAWRSPDQGQTWFRTTAPNIMPSVSCIAQDTRKGKTNTWYYGTGESVGNSEAYPVESTQSGYSGDGIFKSSDGGQTWSVLPQTVTTGNTLNQPFNFVNTIAIDPSNLTQDIIYAATIGGIMRSTNGGATWSATLGGGGEYYCTDVKVSSNGIVYAAISQINYSSGSSYGIYRSTDGVTWTNITPSGWESSSGVISIDVAPSNGNILYAAFNTPTGTEQNYFWKYTYLSGNGAGSSGTWIDNSANLPSGSYGSGLFNAQGGYDLYIRVKPDNPNTVYIGGVDIYCSTDGLATKANVHQLDNRSYIHVDHHSLAFMPGNPSEMVVGSDGGLFMTNNDLALEQTQWQILDQGYFTSQFYTVAIEHGTTGSSTVIGGMQDNGVSYSTSIDATKPWAALPAGDGATCAIPNGASSYYYSDQQGTTYRQPVNGLGDAQGTPVRIDPAAGSGGLWVQPYALDPNDQNRMYFAGSPTLWRCDNLTSIPFDPQNAATTGWAELTKTSVSPNYISAVAVCTTPENRVYYGTTAGQVFRLDNASASNPTPMNVTASSLAAGSFINSIAVDPQDGDNAMAVISNYNVQSLFYTSDGGTTWTAVGGNLEGSPSGVGNGPSCRSAQILHVGNSVAFLVGTSTGLYSTAYLNGTSTVWMQEGASSIGNNVVDMVDARQSDGFVAVATHGGGIYSGNYTSLPTAPATPTLISPANGASNVPVKAVLQWSSVSGAEYHVQVATNQDFTNIVFDQDLIPGADDSTTTLNSYTTYYWRVKAEGPGGISSGGENGYTPAWQFTTAPGVPLAPVLIAPVAGASGLSIKPTLAWSKVTGATTYQLQIATGISFTNPVVNDSLISDTSFFPTSLSANQGYWWQVRTINQYGKSAWSVKRKFTTGASAVHEISALSRDLSVYQNYPNPFTNSTNFGFYIPHDARVSLKIYNALGNEVTMLVNDWLSAGEHTTQWDASNYPSGVYFYNLRSGDFSQTKQMLLLK